MKEYLSKIMSMKPLNRRIPGILPPPPKTELDGKVTEIANKTIAELKELRDRQVKLINNKSFISKLTDKGEKINGFLTKILIDLKNKEEELQTCSMLEKLKLNGVDRESVQDIEWRKDNTGKKDAMILDSDDESEPEDVLHIISQRTAQEKTVKVLPSEKPLITPEDLLSIGEIPHVKYIVDKTELNTNIKPQTKFKPHKTTKTDVHDPGKEACRKKGKHWEVTAATPPPILHGPTKILTIEESLNLQKEHNIHLKEVEAQHAAEKLMARIGVKMAGLPEDTTSFANYREAGTESEDTDPEGSDKEVHDEEPEKGGVIFTVMK